MTIDAPGAQFTVTRLRGVPMFVAADRLEHEILAEAGLAQIEPPSRGMRSPTTFHVAVSADGRPLAAGTSTVGDLAEVPLGLALRHAEVEITELLPLPGPVAELVSLSVDEDAEPVPGVTEALYRSFYQQAKRDGVRSLVVGILPWVFDVLNEQYGIAFEVIGPPLERLGREILPVGGTVDALERELSARSPDFLAFLQEPDGAPIWT